jgi:D-alanyl-D-alanine carboxypeptidase
VIHEEMFNHIVNKMVDHKKVYSAVLCVENSDKSISWTGAAGNMNIDSRYFIASVTKLYITAIVMRLIEENLLNLNDKISKYLPAYVCENIHVYKSVDYSDRITVCHLISNTSGLPDYFFHKQANGKTVASELMEGKDEAWNLDKSINLVKKLKPKFKPGAKGKASYSDTNYQLLGCVIENITGKSINDVFEEFIFSELKLTNTYVYNDPSDTSPVPFYDNTKQLWLPEYMASIASEGGIVSTAGEVMVFLKAFFNGHFFPKEKIESLKQWNLIWPPPGLFFYGIGLERIWTPWFISPFKPIKEILGFWGQTGSFAFYNPESDLFFTGTTNQVNGAGHRIAGSAMLKLIKAQHYRSQHT